MDPIDLPIWTSVSAIVVATTLLLALLYWPREQQKSLATEVVAPGGKEEDEESSFRSPTDGSANSSKLVNEAPTSPTTHKRTVVDMVIVCMGEPGKSMGWYHATQVLDGLCPAARLTDVVEPRLLGTVVGRASKAARLLAAFMEANPDVRFHASVSDMPAVKPGTPKVALVAGRSQYNPRLVREVIDKGCTTIYLEKPGAPTVSALESLAVYAKEKSVQIYMGYNKNVSKYVEEAVAAEKAEGAGCNVTFFHNNQYKPEELPLVFERDKDGMLKNMVIHELALLVSFYGVTADNIDSVKLNTKYSSMLTLEGPETFQSFTDFDKIGFTLHTRGKTVSVYADRCDTQCHSEAVVTAQRAHGTSGGSIEGKGKGGTKAGKNAQEVVCRTRIPDRKLEDEIAAKTRNDPYCYPYFYLYHHEYAVLKQRVCEAACVLDSESYDSIVRANGVATIEVAIEALKVAEKLTAVFAKELRALKNNEAPKGRRLWGLFKNVRSTISR